MWKENSEIKATEDTGNTASTASTPDVQGAAPKPRRRGFAAMTPEQVREISSKGGKAAHAAGTAHEFTPAEAKVAGQKGGTAHHVSRGGIRKPKISADAGVNRDDGILGH